MRAQTFFAEKRSSHIPKIAMRTLNKSSREKEFLKKIIKDDELIKKIAICKENVSVLRLIIGVLVEKRNTEFDKKSSDLVKKKDYIPNYTLLTKFGLSSQRDRNQTGT